MAAASSYVGPSDHPRYHESEEKTSSAGLSGPSAADLSKEKTNGTRLARLLIDEGTKVLMKFLHSMHPESTLQNALNNNRQRSMG